MSIPVGRRCGAQASCHRCCSQLRVSTPEEGRCPTDFRLVDLLLRTAGDPEIGLGEYSTHKESGSDRERGCQGCLHSTSRRKNGASLLPLDYLEHSADQGGVWRRNCSTLQAFEEQVLEVMHDQATRGQIIVLTETEAKNRFPNLVIASPGEQRKEKPGGKISDTRPLRKLEDTTQTRKWRRLRLISKGR